MHLTCRIEVREITESVTVIYCTYVHYKSKKYPVRRQHTKKVRHRLALQAARAGGLQPLRAGAAGAWPSGARGGGWRAAGRSRRVDGRGARHRVAHAASGKGRLNFRHRSKQGKSS